MMKNYKRPALKVVDLTSSERVMNAVCDQWIHISGPTLQIIIDNDSDGPTVFAECIGPKPNRVS